MILKKKRYFIAVFLLVIFASVMLYLVLGNDSANKQEGTLVHGQNIIFTQDLYAAKAADWRLF